MNDPIGDNPKRYLESLQDVPDHEVSLGVGAIALAAMDQPGISTQRYVTHLDKLCAQTKERFDALVEEGADDSDCGTRLAALKYVLNEKHAYQGDEDNFEDIQNANIIRVIERAKGMSITLSILYIHVARALEWDIDGLDIPGHFLCRLQVGSQRLIFDPFNQCQIMGAPDIRMKIKDVLGEEAEISASYFEPLSNRQILVGLQNNIKFRKIALEDYEGALESVEAMRLIDPQEYRLLLDAGVLYARLARVDDAEKALEGYIAQAPYNRDRQEAEALLYELRLNRT